MSLNRRAFSISLATAVSGLLSACRLRSDPGEFQEGLVVGEYLAQDLEIQALLEKNIASALQAMTVKKLLPPDSDGAAVVIENSTGNVLGYVGTIQKDSNYDNARRLARSCGSLGKPFFYAAALHAGVISPNETILDSPACFPCSSCKGGSYCPENHGNVYANAPLPVAVALALSRNIPAIGVFRKLDPAAIDGMLEKLGLPKPANYMTAPLGWEITPLEMASAYTVFANRGHSVEPRFITHTVVNGQKQETPIKRRDQVFSKPVCDWAISAMRLCLTHGTGQAASSLSGFLAGKTGSSDSAWAALFSQQVTAVCWVGRLKTNKDMGQTGGSLAMPRLAAFFSDLRRIRPDLTEKWESL